MTYIVKTIGEGEEWETQICSECDSEAEWVACDQCEEGYSDHDCGEDTCCCLNPESNVVCDTCEGKGGWWVCSANCHDKGVLKKQQ
jgi:hypothetical protein